MTVNFFDCADFYSFKNTLSVTKDVSFTLVHVNIRSIRKHWDQFRIIVDNIQDVVDAFVLTEINISSDEVGQFGLNGFNNFFFTRHQCRGGGIGVYIRDMWAVAAINVSFMHAESVVLTIQQADYSLNLLSIYRPPSNSVVSFLDELHDVLNEFDSATQICLVGDINIDILNTSKSSVSDYLNILAHFGIECCIQAPTREELLQGRLVTSSIDHINIRTNEAEIRSAVISQKLADHYFIGCHIIPIKSYRFSTTNALRISVVDQNKFDNLVSSFDWDGFVHTRKLEDLYPGLVEMLATFKESSKRYITIKKRRPDQAWLSTHILEAIKHKDFLWSRCRRSTKNDLFKMEFKIARNKVNALIRSAKRAYYKKQFFESRFNVRKTWSLANELRGVGRRHTGEESITQAFNSDAQSIADQFNSFFARQSGAERRSHDKTMTLQESVTDSAFLPTLSELDLRSIVFNLNRNKSSGLDGVKAADLRRNFEALKKVLLLILNNIIETGIFPETLKSAIVRPLFKGGAPNNVENYRPISILSCISQILEKHLFLVMTSFLDKSGVLSPHQYGFVAGRGTGCLLDDFADNLYSSFENNQFTCALFLDISKAFDTINHNILCYKLEKLGFRGPFLCLLKNFLFERSQLVAIGEVKSSIISLKAGVPQGSVLSPLLFNLYVNDLPKAARYSQVYQYADDTVLLSRHLYYADAITLLQKDSIAIMDWFDSNLINVNISKTNLVCFRNPLKTVSLSIPFFLHTSHCVSCNCIPIEYVHSVKYLGIFFDSDLSWNTHLSYICKRLRSVTCCLYRIKAFLPISVRKQITHALAYSLLRYGITVFGHCSGLWHNKVDSILKSILKSISFGYNVPEETSLFVSLQLPSFQALFMETVVLRHYWSDVYKTNKSPVRLLRQTPRFIVPYRRTRYGESVRDCYVPQIFNSLPDTCFDLSSRTSLKKALRAIRC